MSGFGKPRPAWGAALLAVALAGCAVDPLDDLPESATSDGGLDSSGNPEAVRAWIWTMDGGSLRAIHAVDRLAWDSFALDYRAEAGWTEGAMAGGDIYPTWWTFSGRRLRAFQNGILDHGDHGHIVRLCAHADVTFSDKDSIAHLAVSPDHATIVLALASRDGTGSIVKLGYLKADTTRRGVDTAPSRVAVLAGSALASTRSGTLRAWSLPDLEPLTVPALPDSCRDVLADPSGGSYWAATPGGIHRWKPGTSAWETISSTVAPRRFLSSGRGDMALGLFEGASGCAERVAILRLSVPEAVAVAVDAAGACLPDAWASARVDLSDDGSTALLADGSSPELHRLHLSTGTFESVAVSAIATSVALDWGGTHAWFLREGMVRQVSFARGRVVDSATVASGTSAISISSFSDNSNLYDAPDHVF